MKEFSELRAKTCAYLIDDYDDDYDDNNIKHKKAKGTNKSLIKRSFMFENYMDCLFNNKTILQPQQKFKSDCHDVYTEQINKIALSSNDDKRLQIFDKITTYLYGKNIFRGDSKRFAFGKLQRLTLLCRNNITITAKIRYYKCKYK